jgi:hypothetical protein
MTSVSGDVPEFAYFFVPVPEPLRFPSGFVVESVVPVSFEDLWEHSLGEVGDPPEVALGCSILVWQIERPTREVVASMLGTLVEAARRGLPPGVVPEAAQGDAHAAEEDAVFVQTVLEVLVPLQGSVTQADDETASDLLTEAFDRGLDAVRHMQSAHHLATYQPITLVTQEALPPYVPYVVRRVTTGRTATDDWGEGLDMFLVNDSMLHAVRGPDLSSDELDRVQAVFDTVTPDRAFVGASDLERDARAALRRGDYRASVVTAEAAAEVFLYDLLLHMLWEESTDPDEAAATYFEDVPFRKRVRTFYHPRLRGNWSVDTGPLATWSTNLSALRHRVVHAGYQPRRTEAYAALDALGRRMGRRPPGRDLAERILRG